MHKTLEVLRNLLLIGLAVSAIIIGIFDVIGSPLTWVKDISSITLILLSWIALDLCFERFTTINRIEQKIDSATEIKEFGELPGKVRSAIKNSIRDYIQVRNVNKISKNENPDFSKISEEIVADQALSLKNLSLGRLEFPSNQIAVAHGKIASLYKKRLNAVSCLDLNFWMKKSPIAEEYFRLNKNAASRGTKITRIFVLSTEDITSNFVEVAKVLQEQQRAGIGWGIAVYEELEFDLTQNQEMLDFAIFDDGLAVSYFRNNDGRKFEAIFSVSDGHQNNYTIDQQKRIHKRLIVECWLANTIFKNLYPLSLSKDELKKIKRDAAFHNENLNNKIGRKVVEDDTFVLLSSSPNDIEDKVLDLAKIVADWKKA